jgi:hypothetical protein
MMTTGTQRTNALIQAGDFLEELRASEDPSIPEALRRQARVILRNYPSTYEICRISEIYSRQRHLGPDLDASEVPPEKRGPLFRL